MPVVPRSGEVLVDDDTGRANDGVSRRALIGRAAALGAAA
jgi:hypothetical protein